MKYFTHDLLLRFGSENDAIADAAHEEWENVNRKYLRHLEHIRPLLPRGARSLLRRFCLHDARLVMLATCQDKLAISIFVELDRAANRGVLLSYDLIKPFVFVKLAPSGEKGVPIEWLYDEFGLSRGRVPAYFTHSILFTGGRELRLAFRNLQVRAYEKVVLPSAEADASELDTQLVG